MLDYRAAESIGSDGRDHRFFGGFESVAGQMLWMRGETLTISADLTDARLFLLPAESEADSAEDGGMPRPIKWSQVAALSEGAKIFVGGKVRCVDGRARFQADRRSPLLVILYDGSERSLLMRAVRAGRQKNEYWNPATPFALAIGVFSQLMMALSYVNRPALSAAFTAALTGAFGPLMPFLPPGLLLTALSRGAWRRGRAYRALRDLARLPLLHLRGGQGETILPDGSRYALRRMDEARFSSEGSAVPRLPAEAAHDSGREEWFCYGRPSDDGERIEEPRDPSALFAALPAAPEALAAEYSVRARFLEIAAGAALAAGTAINAMLAYLLIETAKRG